MLAYISQYFWYSEIESPSSVLNLSDRLQYRPGDDETQEMLAISFNWFRKIPVIGSKLLIFCLVAPSYIIYHCLYARPQGCGIWYRLLDVWEFVRIWSTKIGILSLETSLIYGLVAALGELTHYEVHIFKCTASPQVNILGSYSL